MQIWFGQWFQEASVLGVVIYRNASFSKYQTGGTAVHIFEMIMWLITKSEYFELVASQLLPELDLDHRFQEFSLLGWFDSWKADVRKYQTRSIAVHIFETVMLY